MRRIVINMQNALFCNAISETLRSLYGKLNEENEGKEAGRQEAKEAVVIDLDEAQLRRADEAQEIQDKKKKVCAMPKARKASLK